MNVFSRNIMYIKVFCTLIYQINIVLYCILIYSNILFPI